MSKSDIPDSQDAYIDYINGHILPHIDYAELKASCETGGIYAKGVLNLLHEAMLRIYGGGELHASMTEDGFVTVPGIVRGLHSEKICIVLLTLDLSSSGEHWGTDFLCEYGIIPQTGAPDDLEELSQSVGGEYIPYEYAYTAAIPCDIHVRTDALSRELKDILSDFRSHLIDLQKNRE